MNKGNKIDPHILPQTRGHIGAKVKIPASAGTGAKTPRLFAASDNGDVVIRTAAHVSRKIITARAVFR
jgi:hypothetical protein